MNTEYRLCTLLFLWLGCLFYAASGTTGDFSVCANVPFETFSSAEEKLNDDLPALRQTVSGKTLNASSGSGGTAYGIPDRRISFSKVDRGFGTSAVKSSSLIFIPLRC